MADIASIKYRAFLSYSHRDVGWARWLHSRLEAFRFDKDLVGRATPHRSGAEYVAADLSRPRGFFRRPFADRRHARGHRCLGGADRSVFAGIRHRPVVNEEVRLFRSRHPERPVIPVIIEGTAPDNFPPALRFELAADGSVTDRPITILGPDLRESADGKSLGLAKTIAGLTGLGADDIFRRAERARRRQTRIWSAVAGFCLLLAVAATGSAIYAWQQLKTNEAFLNAALKTATDIVDTAVAQADKYNVPRAATLELLNKADGLFDTMASFGRPTPELRFRRRNADRVRAQLCDLGETKNERSHAEEAIVLADLAAAKPDDATYQIAPADAYDEVGKWSWRRASGSARVVPGGPDHPGAAGEGRRRQHRKATQPIRIPRRDRRRVRRRAILAAALGSQWKARRSGAMRGAGGSRQRRLAARDCRSQREKSATWGSRSATAPGG